MSADPPKPPPPRPPAAPPAKPPVKPVGPKPATPPPVVKPPVPPPPAAKPPGARPPVAPPVKPRTAPPASPPVAAPPKPRPTAAAPPPVARPAGPTAPPRPRPPAPAPTAPQPDAPPVTPVFAVAGVSYHYQSVTALDGISLAIQPGKRVALLGANGSGKSTLLRLLDGLYFPESGAISFHGQPLTRERLDDDQFAFDFRRRVGLVFQNPDVQLFNPTVFDEVAFAPLQLRLPTDEITRRVEAALDLMEIVHLKHRPPHRLSGGEKKRVALASVLVLDPDVLLLDEPTAALDPRSQSQIIDLLIGWGNGSKTVITATHDLGLVEDISDYCYLLQHGKLLAEGKPDQLLRNQPLLESANLVHAHRHRHPEGGLTHSHPHTHPHRHE